MVQSDCAQEVNSMASFSLEDIQTLRRCSNLTYEEAVDLLEYHGGSLAQALLDLEKQGRLKDRAAPECSAQDKQGFIGLLQKAYRIRIQVRHGEDIILNLSLIYLLIAIPGGDLASGCAADGLPCQSLPRMWRSVAGGPGGHIPPCRG